MEPLRKRNSEPLSSIKEEEKQPTPPSVNPKPVPVESPRIPKVDPMVRFQRLQIHNEQVRREIEAENKLYSRSEEEFNQMRLFYIDSVTALTPLFKSKSLISLDNSCNFSFNFNQQLNCNFKLNDDLFKFAYQGRKSEKCFRYTSGSGTDIG